MVTRLLTLILILTVVPAFSAQKLYTPPRSLDLAMEQVKPDGELQTFAVELKVLLGTVTQIKVYFEASDELVCEPSVQSFASLTAGEIKQLSFSCKVNKEALANPKTWVRCRIEYLPDYSAITTQINTDTNEYPDKNLRSNLLEVIEQNITEQRKAVDAVRHFFVRTNN